MNFNDRPHQNVEWCKFNFNQPSYSYANEMFPPKYSLQNLTPIFSFKFFPPKFPTKNIGHILSTFRKLVKKETYDIKKYEIMY